MPREKPPTRFFATDSSPVISITSRTRALPMPCVAAMASRWLWALRPVWTAFASSSAPTSRRGERCWAYGRPLTVTVPRVGRSSPTIIRIVVDLPAPFGPRKPVTLPGWTVNETLSTAVVIPYRLVRPWASIMAGVLRVDGCLRVQARARSTPGGTLARLICGSGPATPQGGRVRPGDESDAAPVARGNAAGGCGVA